MAEQSSFHQLFEARTWRQIPHCPGRYIATALDERLTVAELAGFDEGVKAFESERAQDTVLVMKIPGGGIISYLLPNRGRAGRCPRCHLPKHHIKMANPA